MNDQTLTPNLRLLAQLVALGLLGHDVPGKLHGVFLPFFAPLDVLHGAAFVPIVIAVLLYVSLGLLVLGRAVRLNAVVAGLTLLAALLASRAYYKNDLVYCAAILFMVGVSDRDGWLPRVQLAIVYAAAAFNKVQDPDWWNGRFFGNWLEVGARTPYMDEAHYVWFPELFARLGELFPPLRLSQAISIVVMLTELALAVGLLLPRTRKPMVAVGLLFHAALTITIGECFGVFFYGMSASYCAFVEWPARSVVVRYGAGNRWAQRLRAFARLGPQQPALVWSAEGDAGDGSPLRAEIDGVRFSGLAAGTRVFLQLKQGYYVIALALIAPSWGSLVSYPLWAAGFWLRNVVLVALMVALLPLLRSRAPAAPARAASVRMAHP